MMRKGNPVATTTVIGSAVLAAAALAGCGSDAGGAGCDTWLQWGQSADHRGGSCVAGQELARPLTTIAFDMHIAAEKADADGDILVHFQAPLVIDDDLYMEWKAGTYTPCTVANSVRTCALYRRDTQVWAEKGYRWQGGALVEKWLFTSDWKPMPSTGGFEPMFQPAVAGDFIYVPGAGGTLHKLTRVNGLAVGKIQPFGTAAEPDRYVSGPITVALDGTLYYNTIKYDHDAPTAKDVEAMLVKVAPDGKTQTVSYQTLVPGAPATDLCRGIFSTRTTPRPWPPADDANGAVLPATTFPCLSQRPSWNVAPAVAADGTIYTVSRAHASDRVAFLVAVKPDLTPRWARSLQRILNDGCGGEFLPIDGDQDHLGDCRIGARVGVDPSTNELPSARAIDDSSSSPVTLPDGAVLYGAYTSYNLSRGHLVKVSAAGEVAATFGFGWDVTPAIWERGGKYSIVIKDNYYDYDQNGVGKGPYYIRQLDASLKTEWALKSTNTKSCTRKDDGSLECVDDHPSGFEWCINAPAIDKNGTVYANSEDGNVYAIPQGGGPAGVKTAFLAMAVGAAYTPLALDAQGRVITLNDGKLTVLGK